MMDCGNLRHVWLLAGFVLMLAAQHASARPLTVSEQKSFQSNFYVACMAGPHIREMIRRKGGNRKQHSAYCRCAGSFFARKVSYAQAVKPVLAPASLHQRAVDYCLPRAFR